MDVVIGDKKFRLTKKDVAKIHQFYMNDMDYLENRVTMPDGRVCSIPLPVVNFMMLALIQNGYDPYDGD